MVYKMTEEHKKKIGEANKIAMRKFLDKNPNWRNNGMFKKGVTSLRKGKHFKNQQEENHPDWKGGNRSTARRMAKRRGIPLNKCRFCGDQSKRIDIHHIDGNYRNNKTTNWAIICSYCHWAVHENGRATRFK